MEIEGEYPFKPVFGHELPPSDTKEVPLKNSAGEIIGSAEVTFENGAFNVKGTIDSGIDISESNLGQFFSIDPDVNDD